MDDGRLGGNASHLRAWTALERPDGWCLVVEDDAILCEDFLSRLDDALQSKPAPVVSMYLGTSYPPHLVANARRALERAQAAGERYTVLPTLNHAVAVAIRQSLIADR